MGRSKIVGVLPRLPLEVLRYVVLIADHGSTVAAAHLANLTSPSLSRKIAQLEHELGCRLFERHSRGMRPTDAGYLVVAAARDMIARMERLATDIDDADSTERGTVKVYVSQSLVEHFLMPQVVRTAGLYPNVKFDVVVAAGRQAERALIEDSGDFALILTVPRHADIEIVAERGNRVAVLVSPNHPLATRRRIDATELAAVPFAALPASYSSRLAFNSLLPDAMADMQPQLTVNSIAALKAYALSGVGAAIVPELTLHGTRSEERLVMVDLAGAEKTDTRMCLCRRRSRTLGSAAKRLLADLARSFKSVEAGVFR
jgi:DNA-binding transcriptional LysR family regulator